jgi:hypothetical protein
MVNAVLILEVLIPIYIFFGLYMQPLHLGFYAFFNQHDSL